MRENRPYGSEGGVGANRSRPLSVRQIEELEQVALGSRLRGNERFEQRAHFTNWSVKKPS